MKTNPRTPARRTRASSQAADAALPAFTGDAQQAAAQAGLRYVTDTQPGMTRRRAGRGFSYRTRDGNPVRDTATLRRIRSLVIPPAWSEVWICPVADGHIQAVGRDARGRKQYRYHPQWNTMRDNLKYDRMVAFAKGLPALRNKLDEDLSRRGLPREKVLAAVVRLLETTLIRVGNDEYAKNNGSVGLTTMKNDHVDVDGSRIRFEFRGKSGVEHEIDLKDPRLARIVARCQELPGQELFEFVDEDGSVHDVRSDDVNRYLKEVMGEEFTAKDFRTWAGTALCAMALQEFETFDSQAAAKRNVTRAIESVAARLGNTKTVCRKSYVHPAIIEAYLDRTLIETLKKGAERQLREDLHSLTPEEAAVLTLLQQRMERENARPARRAARRSRPASSKGGRKRVRNAARASG